MHVTPNGVLHFLVAVSFGRLEPHDPVIFGQLVDNRFGNGCISFIDFYPVDKLLLDELLSAPRIYLRLPAESQRFCIHYL